jgi:hypothetical protein
MDSAAPLPRAPKAADDFSVLEERLQLLEQLRELSALRCQRFAELLEAQVAQRQQQEQEESEDEDDARFFRSLPCSSDSDSSLSFPAQLYYSRSVPRSHRRAHRHQRSRRSSMSSP